MSRPEVLNFPRTPELLAQAREIIAPWVDAWAGQRSPALGRVLTTPANTLAPAFCLLPPRDVLWSTLDASEYMMGINPFHMFRVVDDRYLLLVHDVYALPRFPVKTYFRLDPVANARPPGYVSPFGRFSPYSAN